MRNFAAGCALVIFGLPIAAILSLAIVDPALLEQLFWWTVYGLGGVAVAAFVLIVAVMEHRRERQDRTMQDGAWRLLKYRYREWNNEAPWPIALFEYIVGHPGELDRNRIPASAYVIKHGKVIEHRSIYGDEIQHSYNQTVEHTNIFRSIFPGHSANTNMFGRDATPPKLPGRSLLNRPDRPQLPGPTVETIEDGEFRPVLPATLTEALAQHRGPDLLLGQSKSGDLALWTPQSDPHLGVWGKSGGGKTTRLGLSLAICQIMLGWRVLIIDPEQEGDTPAGHWGQLAPWAQVVGPGEPGCSIWDELMSWYERRWKSVASAGASDAWHMPEGRALRPLAVHFDELSRWRMMAGKRDGAWKNYASRVDDALSEIGMRGRKRGVHMTLYGQLPGELPETVAGSLTNLTFRQPDNQGNKVGYWAAHQLAQGEFAYNGKVYNSFSGLLEAPKILGNREAPKPILSGGATVPTECSSKGGVSIETVLPEVDTPQLGTWNGGTDDDSRWSDVVDAWFARNPQALIGSPNGINDLARAMCQYDTGEPSGYEDYKSRAHRLYHAFRSNVRLPKGGKIGVDITHNGVAH